MKRPENGYVSTQSVMGGDPYLVMRRTKETPPIWETLTGLKAGKTRD